MDREIRLFFIILFVLSICLNVYLLVKKQTYTKQQVDKKSLYFWKAISHKDGFKFYNDKMKADFEKTYTGQKMALVVFWDSIAFDFTTELKLKIFDSIAGELGRYSFDYVFATEMDETAAKSFLINRGIEFKNFKVIGGMDDFISGVYNEKPVIWKSFSLNGKKDTVKINRQFSYLNNKKVKPFYFLMDNKGEILYHNYQYLNPRGDTTLMKKLILLSTTKTLNDKDY